MNQSADVATLEPALELVTMTLSGYAFGIGVKLVHDILGPQAIAPVPLASSAVAGSINLRGRIVTVLDLGVVLGFDRSSAPERAMNVVIADDKELYALLVDQVGDVLSLPGTTLEPLPPTFPTEWKAISDGIVRLQDHLLLTLDPDRILAAVKEKSGPKS